MISILGKTTSINVRKMLWTCEEAGIAYQQEDYGSGFASTETDAFRAFDRPGPPALPFDRGVPVSRQLG